MNKFIVPAVLILGGVGFEVYRRMGKKQQVLPAQQQLVRFQGQDIPVQAFEQQAQQVLQQDLPFWSQQQGQQF